MRNRLFSLLASNARRGRFEARGNEIAIYDAIVASEIEAEFFGGVAPSSFRKALAATTGPVTIRIDSPGGDVFAARNIAQAIREHDQDVSVIVDGLAASAASLIAVSVSSVRMAPGSMMMIHKAWTLGFGNSDDLLATAALLEKIDDTLAETYAAKGAGDKERYAALMAAETWFTAAEAVAEGLADEAIEDVPRARSAWNLSAYDNAPDTDPAADEESERNARVRRLTARLLTT